MQALVRSAKRIVRSLGGRRLVLGALGVVAGAGAVAAMLEAWHLAVAILIVIQFAIVVGVADLRRRTARQHDLQNTLRTIRTTEKRLQSTRSSALAAVERSRTDLTELVADLRADLQNTLRNVRTTEERLQSTESSVLAAVERSRTDLTELVADLRADLKQRKEVVTSADLERMSASIRAAVAHQARQAEAMFQLVQRIGPRAGTPASGGWAMDAENVLVLLDLVADQRPALVVELGGGTSTIWLGYALQQWGGGRLVSIEHDETYASTTRGEVQRHGLADVVDVRLATFQDSTLDGHAAPWYDIREFESLAGIDLLVIDGPPQATGKMARFPAVPLLWDQLSPTATVVLDDAHRDDEQKSLELWCTQFPELTVTARSRKDHLVALRRGSRAAHVDV